MIKLVLCDLRKDSSTYKQVDEFFIGDQNPMLVRIPTGVANGFNGIGNKPAIVANCATEPYDYKKPDDVRIDPHDKRKQKRQLGFAIPYDWKIREG